jgi:hypothetical protein
MSPIDEAIKQGQRRYQTTRNRLNSLLPTSGRENTLNRVRESLEEFGLAETSRRLRSDPELLGLKRKSDADLVAKLESACRVLTEARDALDWAIADSPQCEGPDGWLMAFDGKLARVTADGKIREIDAPERERDQDNEDWDQDREP